ncbi:multiple antibiotic resistance protein MarB [Klebsiella pneumoniae]|nr:multiple antibiotic resistance protein MarB [Klebsiella pneumoniae]MBC4860443.1 multiple antibiotic resistance protein MarB [Klebsiella pneumoniae]VTN21579.1 multiple antibiotic resistance protein MarB [Klebsiella pneumoniae]
MKLFAAAAIVLLSLASSLSYAEQNTTPVRQNQRDTMIIPSEHNDSTFDFNHMAAGNDKSDELGVPYYQQHDL